VQYFKVATFIKVTADYYYPDWGCLGFFCNQWLKNCYSKWLQIESTTSDFSYLSISTGPWLPLLFKYRHSNYWPLKPGSWDLDHPSKMNYWSQPSGKRLHMRLYYFSEKNKLTKSFLRALFNIPEFKQSLDCFLFFVFYEFVLYWDNEKETFSDAYLDQLCKGKFLTPNHFLQKKIELFLIK